MYTLDLEQFCDPERRVSQPTEVSVWLKLGQQYILGLDALDLRRVMQRCKVIRNVTVECMVTSQSRGNGSATEGPAAAATWPSGRVSLEGVASGSCAIGGILPDWCGTHLTVAFTAALLCILPIEQGRSRAFLLILWHVCWAFSELLYVWIRNWLAIENLVQKLVTARGTWVYLIFIIAQQIPTKLATSNSTYLLSQFQRSKVWTLLIWILCFRISSGYNLGDRAEVSSEAQLEKTLLPNSFKVLIEFMFLQRNSCKIAFQGQWEKERGRETYRGRGRVGRGRGERGRRDCFESYTYRCII